MALSGLLEDVLNAHAAISIAVDSSTLNDLTRLVAQRCAQPYMIVATAASLDGYTACGMGL